MVDDGTTDEIQVTNGLRQGCTFAPTLYNLYFSAMVAYWRDWCLQAGVRVRFKMGRKLVEDKTAKVRFQVTKIFESKFTDDVALCATSGECTAKGKWVSHLFPSS